MRKTVEINGKTYKVSTLDVGLGPRDYVFVRVAMPHAVLVNHGWRQVPRNGPVWNAVMSKARQQQGATR